jgi:VanZ family protein
VAAPRWLLLIGFWLPFAFTTYSAFAPEGVPMPFRVSDVILHAGAFTYLTAALWLAYYRSDRGVRPAVWMLLYGVGIELVQSFEPTRTAEFKDLLVDAVGILLGLGLYRFVLIRVFPPIAAADVSQPRSR